MNGIPRLVRRIHGSAIIAVNLRGQRAVPFWPREKVEALRDRRIREMVRYAARTAPYYRDFFRDERIDPRDIRTAADLDRLPVLDRELVRAEPRRFLAAQAAARGSLSFLTSGSTGRPVEIWHDRRSLLLNIPYGEREREVLIQAAGTFRPRELYVGYETSTFKKVIAFYAGNVLFPVTPRRTFIPLSASVDVVLETANRERPDILVGYGGWLDIFFSTLEARGLRLEPPKLVMYMGEALPHGARERIERGFGIPVLSRYNAVESFKIGYMCGERTGFHVHEDICHVRIADDNGEALPAGSAGRVVLTNLINRATVLLNYPIGDVAALTETPCPCGRTFRLLSELEGRVEDVLELEDGRSLHPRAVWQVMKEDRGILQYQLTQHGKRRFELRLATVDGKSFESSLSSTVPALRKLLAPDPDIEVKRVESFRDAAGGKFRAVANCARNPAADSR